MASPRRALVLDANILIRAVLGPRVRDLILENADRVYFFTPIDCIQDAKRYLPEIPQSKGVDSAPACRAAATAMDSASDRRIDMGA